MSISTVLLFLVTNSVAQIVRPLTSEVFGAQSPSNFRLTNTSLTRAPKRATQLVSSLARTAGAFPGNVPGLPKRASAQLVMSNDDHTKVNPFASVLMGPQGLEMMSPQERLYQRILANEQVTRPDLTNVPINVTVRIMLIKLQDLVERSEVMETTVRVQIGWRDKRLVWDKDEYGQITEILLPSKAVWIPDLAVINSVSDVYSVVRDQRFEIKVENDGQLWWHPTGVLRTFCKLELSYFPFDRQKCSIIVESPTFDRRFLHLRLRPERTPVDLRMYVESETWRLDKAFGTSQEVKAGVSTYFARIEFWLILERARLYHSINFILPCFILSAIQTVFFFLPATHPQRVGSTTVTMLSVMVFQSMVVAQLPKTSESVPLLSIYIDLVILISATSVCASIFTALCHFNYDRRLPIPGWLRSCCGWHRGSFAASASSSFKSSQVRRTREDAAEMAPLNRPSSSTAPNEPLTVTIFPASASAPPQQATISTALSPSNTAHNRHLQAGNRGSSGQRQSPSLSQPSGAARDPKASDPVKQSSRTTLGRLAVGRYGPEQSPFSESCTVLQIPPSPRGEGPSRLAAAYSEEMTVYGVDRNAEGKDVTWIDVLTFINYLLGYICALSISVGPAIIFGLVPSIVDHQDFPIPIGDNFALLTNAQVRKT